MKRYLEYRDDKSEKFWEINVSGSSHTVRFGKVGARGQSKTKEFDSAEEAQKSADRLIASKKRKGYAEVADSSAAPVDRAFKTLVEDVIAAMRTTISEQERDPEMLELMMPKARPPATAEDISRVEEAWGRPLPPSYRDFLLVANGIENAKGTHLLLGTSDQLDGWADEQIDGMSEFWNESDDDPFDREAILPLLVPEAGMGIRDFLAFRKSDDEEMTIVDWDNGDPIAEYADLTSVLEHFLELESAVQATHRAERDARLSDEEVVAFLTGQCPLPESGEVRKQALHRFREIKDPGVVRKAVKHLSEAGLSSHDLMTDLFGGSHPRVGSEAWLEGVALLFAVKVPRDDPSFGSWTRELNNALNRAYTCRAPALEAWADIAREYVRDNAYLGHNLACIYVRSGRIEEAFQMCQAAADVGYPQLKSMRTDSDLGPLLQDDRFLALFPKADVIGTGRTQLPWNEEHAAALDKGEGVEAFGQWLVDEGHPLGEVVLADLEAETEPKKKSKAKNRARKLWKGYVDSVLAPAYPLIANHFTHFLEGEHYFSFHYGLLERFDTFRLSTAEEREEALALLADPHARFVRYLAPRGAVLDDLELVRNLRGLQRINFRWTDITQVTSLEPLSEHRELRALDISNSAVADLEPVAKMPMIQLYAQHTKVTDLSCLEDHPTLSNIKLDETDVRDIEPLLSVPHLCRIGLWDTPLTEEGVAPLKKHIQDAEPLHHEAIMDGIKPWVSHRQVGAED